MDQKFLFNRRKASKSFAYQSSTNFAGPLDIQAKLPPLEEVWKNQEKLNAFGPRLTGNVAHKASLEFIQAELEALGCAVSRDSLSFTRWDVKTYKLFVILENGEEKALPLSAYYPYSGQTGPEGFESEVVLCRKNLKAARGKIALVDVKNIKLPSFLLFKKRSKRGKKASVPAFISNPVIASVLSGPNLEKAAQLGVRGLLCAWDGLSESEAQGQYLPFTEGPQNCPALWISRKTRNILLGYLKKGCRVRFVLDAEWDARATSDTLYALIPGKNTLESLIINTHTDGPNACEENGPLALLALAKAILALPASQRARNTVLVFVTGHFQIPQFGLHGQATSRWLKDHPELWDGAAGHARALAGLTLEHLGCTEWDDDSKHREFAAKGRIERELVYTSSKLLNHLYLKTLEARKKLRVITLNPKGSRYFGEGEPLYDLKIPTVSLVPAPVYLCAQSPTGFLERLDPELLYEQLVSFAKLYGSLNQLEASTILAP